MTGMNCVVDAACASSLIAVKVAVQELLYGDCDTMIAGATCTDNSIGMYMAFSKTPVFSTKPSVTSYDKDTKGMLIGEGSVMFVMKRLADAERDGDRIHAVLRGVASSSDGKCPGIYSPTISGQELAIRRAWNNARLDPKTATLVEGHGTGTPVGDKIELTALQNVFNTKDVGCSREQIAVGSIKSNIGHLKAAAGCAGMLKVILALKHKVLPRHINVKCPPDVDIQNSALYINMDNRPWFHDPKQPPWPVLVLLASGSKLPCCFGRIRTEQTKPYRLNRMPEAVLLLDQMSRSWLRYVKMSCKSCVVMLPRIL